VGEIHGIWRADIASLHARRMSLIQRYRAGDCIAVHDELVAGAEDDGASRARS
jgi:hypothetical protein